MADFIIRKSKNKSSRTSFDKVVWLILIGVGVFAVLMALANPDYLITVIVMIILSGMAFKVYNRSRYAEQFSTAENFHVKIEGSNLYLSVTVLEDPMREFILKENRSYLIVDIRNISYVEVLPSVALNERPAYLKFRLKENLYQHDAVYIQSEQIEAEKEALVSYLEAQGIEVKRLNKVLSSL